MDEKEFEDLTKRRFDMVSCGSLKDRVAAFNQQAEHSMKKLEKNPFSEQYEKQNHKTTDERYGRPEAGSKTERRGIQAGNYIGREIVFLCEIINRFGIPEADGTIVRIPFGLLFEVYAYYSDKIIDRIGFVRPDGIKITTFGRLFDFYRCVSDKVVGMLIRARKHGLVDFEGEMLYQRQDDRKIITMLKPLSEIKQCMQQSGDPQHCLKFDTDK